MNKILNYKVSNELFLTEKVDNKKLKIIIDNFDKYYSKIGHMKEFKTYKDISDKTTILTLLKTYYQKLKKNENVMIYKPSTATDKRRLYSNPSLQTVPKAIRHTIILPGHLDYDFSNCHYEILEQTLKKHNIVCDLLTDYNFNRDIIYEDYMKKNNCNRSMAKENYLSMLNDENKKIIPGEIDFNFYVELRYLQDQIANLYPDILKKCKKSNPSNPKGSCMASFCQMIENILFQCSVEYCRVNNIDVDSSGFDGATIYVPDGIDKEKFCKEMSDFIYEKTDFRMLITFKDFDRMLEVDTTLSKNSIEEFDQKLLSHEMISKYILDYLYENKLIYYSQDLKILYLYNESVCLYEPLEDKKNICKLFSKICEKYFKFIKLDEFEFEEDNKIGNWILKIKLLIYDSVFQNNIYNCMKNNFRNDTDFIDKHFDKASSLFPIADNKVVDFKLPDKDKTRPRIKEDYFTKTTQNKFLVDYDNTYIQNYIGEILNTTDQHFKDDLLNWSAYGLTGESCVKKFPVITGTGDNGKSQFLNLDKDVKGCFGFNCNKKVIFETKNQSNHNAELIPLLNMRTVYFPEPSKCDWFNEDFIKSVTGDDGKMSIRKCGGQEISKDFTMKFIGGVNDTCLPDFKDMEGFTNRILKIPFTNKFERNSAKKEEIMSHKYEYFTELCHYAHRFYMNNRNIIFSSNTINSTNDLINENDNITIFLDENFVKTNDIKDRVRKIDLLKEYQEYCKFNKIIAQGKKFFYKKVTDKGFEVYRERDFKFIKPKCFGRRNEILEEDDEMPDDW